LTNIPLAQASPERVDAILPELETGAGAAGTEIGRGLRRAATPTPPPTSAGSGSAERTVAASSTEAPLPGIADTASETPAEPDDERPDDERPDDERPDDETPDPDKPDDGLHPETTEPVACEDDWATGRRDVDAVEGPGSDTWDATYAATRHSAVTAAVAATAVLRGTRTVRIARRARRTSP
jgi:hypothetical protein